MPEKAGELGFIHDAASGLWKRPLADRLTADDLVNVFPEAVVSTVRLPIQDMLYDAARDAVLVEEGGRMGCRLSGASPGFP